MLAAAKYSGPIAEKLPPTAAPNANAAASQRSGWRVKLRVGVGSRLVTSDQVTDLAKTLVADAANEHQALRTAKWPVLVSVADDLHRKPFADVRDAAEFVTAGRVYVNGFVRRCGRCGLEFICHFSAFEALRTSRCEHRDKQ